MSRARARLEEGHARNLKIWSRADYQAGYEHGVANMVMAFEQALTAVGIRCMYKPYLELRYGHPVMLFKVVLAIPLPAKPDPPIIAPVAGR